MKAWPNTVLLTLFLGACDHDSDPSEPEEPTIHAVEHGYTLEEVSGSYYGLYYHGYHYATPPPGSSFSFFDTVLIEVVADTTTWVLNDLRAGNERFELYEDGSLVSSEYSTYFEGAFTWVGDTLHLQWDGSWHGDFFDDVSYSNFNGKRQ